MQALSKLTSLIRFNEERLREFRRASANCSRQDWNANTKASSFQKYYWAHASPFKQCKIITSDLHTFIVPDMQKRPLRVKIDLSLRLTMGEALREASLYWASETNCFKWRRAFQKLTSVCISQASACRQSALWWNPLRVRNPLRVGTLNHDFWIQFLWSLCPLRRLRPSVWPRFRNFCTDWFQFSVWNGVGTRKEKVVDFL